MYSTGASEDILQLVTPQENTQEIISWLTLFFNS